jgi:hypothetical protein
MTQAQASPGRPIQIDWSTEGKVTVVDQDRHRFAITMQEAAEACSRRNEQIVWADEFNQILSRMHAWTKERSSMVAAAYGALVDREFVFFIVPVGETMNFELSDEIAAAEVGLNHDFANAKVEVRQIPGHDAEALATFLDVDKAILIYGQRCPAPEAMGA